MKAIENVIYGLCRIFGYIAYASLTIIMILISVDVVMRYILNSPIMGSYEITERLLFIAVFTSLAAAQEKKGHLHVTIFLKIMPKKAAYAVYSIGLIIVGITSFVMTYAVYAKGVLQSIDKSYVTVILRIPLTPFYVIEVFCLIIFGLVLLLDGIKAFQAIFKPELESEIDKAWN